MTKPRQPMLPFPPQLVHKSTPLCRARWSPDNVLEARIVATIASRVSLDDHESLTFDIPAWELLGKNYGGEKLEDLRAAAKKLVGRVVTLEDENRWVVVPLISMCEYDKNTGRFRTTISPNIKPHFLWLKDSVLKFTHYNLLEFMALPSVYSQQIFELLQSWKDQPEFTRPLDWLHEWLDTPKTFRENFKAFRQKVLEKAQKHIHLYTSLRFAWEPLKDGRKVVSIRFIFSGRRVAESKLEAARIAEGKVFAASKKRRAACQEAQSCAKAKGGDCALRDRAKFVCEVCDTNEYRKFYLDKAKQVKVKQINDGGLF